MRLVAADEDPLYRFLVEQAGRFAGGEKSLRHEYRTLRAVCSYLFDGCEALREGLEEGRKVLEQHPHVADLFVAATHTNEAVLELASFRMAEIMARIKERQDPESISRYAVQYLGERRRGLFDGLR